MPHKQKTKNKLTLGGEPLPGPEGQGPGAARCPHPLSAPRPPPHPWDVQKAPLAEGRPEAPVQVRGLPAACRPALPQQENRAGLFCLLPGPRAPGPHSPGAERRGNGPSAGGSGLCTQHTHRAHLSPRCTSEAGSRPGCPGRSQGCEQGPLGRGVRSRGGAVQAGPSAAGQGPPLQPAGLPAPPRCSPASLLPPPGGALPPVTSHPHRSPNTRRPGEARECAQKGACPRTGSRGPAPTPSLVATLEDPRGPSAPARRTPPLPQ